MIKTVLLFVYVVIAVLVLLPIGITALILSFLGLRKSMALVIYRVAQGWALLLIKLIKMTGCTITVTGRENIPRSGGVCFVSNHGSIFDIVLLLAYCGRPIGFIAKKELLLLPFLNLWIFLIGGLFIDRNKIRSAIGTINKGVARIKAGGGMIIFPEGHRSRGQGLLPFHPGSLKLATQAQAPIVPVAIAGSYDVFEKQHRVIAAPVKVSFCKPIYTADLPSADRKLILSDNIYSVINGQLGN
jgi:1-acyl-sn-glycerol-3-phosphate acyltransferase